MSDFRYEQYPPGAISTERILAILLRLAPGFCPPLNPPMDLTAYAAKIAYFAEIVVAVHDTGDIGLAALYANDPSGRCGFLTMLAVVPERIGAGFGSGLLQRAIRIADARGMQTIRLEVAKTNRRARDFYAKFGFVPAPDPCSTDGQPTTSIVLERPCTPLPAHRRSSR